MTTKMKTAIYMKQKIQFCCQLHNRETLQSFRHNNT